MSTPIAVRTRRTLFIPLFALALTALVLAGCGSSKSSSPAASTPATTTTATTAATTPATTPTATTPIATAKAKTTAPPAAAASVLHLEANPEGQLKYNTTSLTASAGRVTIDFTNNSPLGHNVTVESSAGKILGATPTFQGGSKTLTLNLASGSYKFFCSVPGHRMAGMEGTLTVTK